MSSVPSVFSDPRTLAALMAASALPASLLDPSISSPGEDSVPGGGQDTDAAGLSFWDTLWQQPELAGLLASPSNLEDAGAGIAGPAMADIGAARVWAQRPEEADTDTTASPPASENTRPSEVRSLGDAAKEAQTALALMDALQWTAPPGQAAGNGPMAFSGLAWQAALPPGWWPPGSRPGQAAGAGTADFQGDALFNGLPSGLTATMRQQILKAHQQRQPIRVDVDDAASVILRLGGGRVSAEFMTADPSAALYLQQHLAELRQRMANQQLPVDELSVWDEGNSGGRNGHDSGAPSSRRQNNPNP
jgi:hypothetical protein